MRQRKKERQEDAERLKKVESEKNMKEVEAEKANEIIEKVWDPNDPMQRAPYFFGGMINDVKRRAPHFLRYRCYIIWKSPWNRVWSKKTDKLKFHYTRYIYCYRCFKIC